MALPGPAPPGPSAGCSPVPLPPGCRSKIPARSSSQQRLTHPRRLRTGASRPVLFRDRRGFHELSLLPGEHVVARPSGPRGPRGGRAGGLSAAAPSVSGLGTTLSLATTPPSCQAHVTGPALIGGRFPPQEKASGGGDSDLPQPQPAPPLSGLEGGVPGSAPSFRFQELCARTHVGCGAPAWHWRPGQGPGGHMGTAETLTPPPTRPHPDAPRSADTGAR